MENKAYSNEYFISQVCWFFTEDCIFLSDRKTNNKPIYKLCLFWSPREKHGLIYSVPAQKSKFYFILNLQNS